MSHRNDVRSEERPGVTARDQVFSQSTPGCLDSILHGLQVVIPFWSVVWVTKSSSRTLYPMEVDMVVMFSRPSSFTCLILSKNEVG